MEDNDTTPEGVKARFAKITEARNTATARAEAAETQIATLQAQITEYGGKMEGFAALTQTNAELEAANASLSGKYSQLEGMVSAGFIDAEDRDLASYYHGKSGTDQPITEWAKTLSADNAPKGLSHLFAPAQATDTPPPPADAPDGPPPPKLPNSNAGTVPPPTPQGDLTGEQIAKMTPSEYTEWRKTQPWHGRSRHQR